MHAFAQAVLLISGWPCRRLWEYCVRLPSMWGIMCPSSNSSYGTLIKRKLEEKKKKGGGGGGSTMGRRDISQRTHLLHTE